MSRPLLNLAYLFHGVHRFASEPCPHSATTRVAGKDGKSYVVCALCGLVLYVA